MEHIGLIQLHATEKTTNSPAPLRLQQTEKLARQWLTAFASFYNVKLSERGERFKEMWVAALTDLGPEELQVACEATIRNCRFFPFPAEIRAQLDQVDRRRIASERWLANQPSDEELRRRGIEYCAKVKTWSQEIVKLQADAQKKAEQQAHARSLAGLRESESKLGERETNLELLARVERQKAELIAKGWSL